MAGAGMLHLLKFRFRRAGREAKPTFFLHIPKCAGSSLWEVIWDIYGTRHVFLAKSKQHHARLEAMMPERRLSYSGIGGHGSLRFFHRMLGDMERYHKIVTLRDPIERVISEYNYISARPQHRLHKVVAAGGFEAFINETSPANRQVKLLTGSTDDDGAAFDIVTKFFDDWSMSGDVGKMADRLYQVTGTTPRPVAHKNKSKSKFNRSDLSPAMLSLIENKNKLDLALLDRLARVRQSP